MSSSFCPKCNEYKGSFRPELHVCPPQWLVRCPEYDGDEGFDEDARKYYAHDAQAAAEKWAERYDSDGDYTIVSGDAPTVYVKKVGEPDDTQLKFVVHGESVPQYSAYQRDTP